MHLSGNTVLVTGGGSGIGLAIAERFLAEGSSVIICGRRADKLKEVQEKHPQIHTRVADVGNEQERVELFKWVRENYPNINVLVNNAGIQRRVKVTEDQESWETRRQEIAINVEAPIHLSSLFIPHFQQQAGAAVINVSSGLAFTPGTFATVYSATKAAIHSFSMSLRQELTKTNVRVIEIVPPAVQTDLGGAGVHTFGVPLNEFADAIMERIAAGEEEVGYGRAEQARKASREEIDEIVKMMNQ